MSDLALAVSEVKEAAIEQAQDVAEAAIEAAQDRAEAAQEMAQALTDAALATAQGQEIEKLRQEIGQCQNKVMSLEMSVQTLTNQMTEAGSSLASLAATIATMQPAPLTPPASPENPLAQVTAEMEKQASESVAVPVAVQPRRVKRSL